MSFINKISFLLFALCSLAFLPKPAQAIQSDVLEVCRGFVFSSNQRRCVADHANSSIQADALRACSNMVMENNQLVCLRTVANLRFQPKAVDLCSGLISERLALSCLEQVAQKAYQAAALEVCSSLIVENNVSGCLQQIEGKTYQAYELQTCEDEILENEKLKCLGEFGSRGRVSPAPRASDELTDILLDALEDAIVDALGDKGPMCEVVNSNGNPIADDLVREEDFFFEAANYARAQRSCVVAHIFGVDNSRTLISSSGVEVARNLSQADLAEERDRRAGYERCRVATCKRQ